MARDNCLEEHELLPLTGGDRADEGVRSHLEECAVCQKRLRQLESEVTTLRKAWTGSLTLHKTLHASIPALADPCPATIGRYRIIGQLGSGGQATVYRAVHPSLSKDVVVKLGHRRQEAISGEPDLIAAEGKVLAELDHPNLARVYDLDIHEGQPFLVMEFIRGRNLRQVASQSKLSPRQQAQLLSKVARALAVAHRHGVIHQDVKPENIIIEEDGNPRLIDFGLVRLWNAWASDCQLKGGTPAYMAPEQAEQFLIGSQQTDLAGLADPRSDIFSLGAVLYFLLTGSPPFDGKDSIEVLKQAQRGNLNQTALQSAEVPRRLAEICLRAIALKPADRYATADELAKDLERFSREPRRWPFVVAAVVLIAAAYTVLWPREERIAPMPAMRQHLVQLIERDKVVTPASAEELLDYVPLRSDDKLVLKCDIPKGYSAAAFCLDSTGNLQELVPTDAVPGGEFDQIRYPASGAWLVDGGSGTMLLLVCAGRKQRPRVQDVQPLLEDFTAKGWPWPALPPTVLLLLGDNEVEPIGERPRQLTETPLTRVWDDLEKLRLGLKARFDFSRGVALPQQ